MLTIKTIAAPHGQTRGKAVFALIFAGLLAGGCSALPEPPPRPLVYDFGPALPAAQPGLAQPGLAPLALAEVESVGLPEASAALLYRLAYANAQQLQPYTLARWSQPPALLVQQALREQLGQQRAVLSGEDGVKTLLEPGRLPSLLRVQLEEFSQVFETPQRSYGLLRLRVSLADVSLRGETLVAQRLFMLRQEAATPDAAGGARALAEAARQASAQVAQWLAEQGR